MQACRRVRPLGSCARSHPDDFRRGSSPPEASVPSLQPPILRPQGSATSRGCGRRRTVTAVSSLFRTARHLPATAWCTSANRLRWPSPTLSPRRSTPPNCAFSRKFQNVALSPLTERARFPNSVAQGDGVPPKPPLRLIKLLPRGNAVGLANGPAAGGFFVSAPAPTSTAGLRAVGEVRWKTCGSRRRFGSA